MNTQILRLVILGFLVLVGGMSAQADDYFVNLQVIEGSSYCNTTQMSLAFHEEWNVSNDARLYVAVWLNGIFIADGDNPLIPGYYNSNWATWSYGLSLPYTYRTVWIFYSDSGQMPSHAFAFNLYCDVYSHANVSLDILY